jgi:cytochrome c biogenesis protein CcmG/thiol:disulfide interchange protein DsbE
MFSPLSSKAANVIRTAAVIAIAGVAIYSFSPTLQNQFGSVKASSERAAPANDVTVKTLEGVNWSLAQQKGKVVLVNFWATWCPPCRIETPALVQLHSKYAAQGFMVAGITMDDDPREVVPEFVRKYAITYPILVPAAQSPMLNNVEVLPTSLLIDRSGRVARTYRGMVTERALRADIESLLAEKGLAQ